MRFQTSKESDGGQAPGVKAAHSAFLEWWVSAQMKGWLLK
jgi:hypothetical protein